MRETHGSWDDSDRNLGTRVTRLRWSHAIKLVATTSVYTGCDRVGAWCMVTKTPILAVAMTLLYIKYILQYNNLRGFIVNLQAACLFLIVWCAIQSKWGGGVTGLCCKPRGLGFNSLTRAEICVKMSAPLSRISTLTAHWHTPSCTAVS